MTFLSWSSERNRSSELVPWLPSSNYMRFYQTLPRNKTDPESFQLVLKLLWALSEKPRALTEILERRSRSTGYAPLCINRAPHAHHLKVQRRKVYAFKIFKSSSDPSTLLLDGWLSSLSSELRLPSLPHSSTLPFFLHTIIVTHIPWMRSFPFIERLFGCNCIVDHIAAFRWSEDWDWRSLKHTLAFDEACFLLFCILLVSSRLEWGR